MRKHLWTVLAALMVLAALAGCAPQTEQASLSGLAADAQIEIVGNGTQIVVTAADMQARAQESFTCTHIDSTGEVSEVTVSGFSLRALLEDNGIALNEISSLNLAASDGYIMSVPRAHYENADVYVLLHYEGDALAYPRSCLPDQRAMYWVNFLNRIELVYDDDAGEVGETVSHISVFREGVNALSPQMLNNFGYTVPAYSLKTYFEKHFGALPQAPLNMIARDGFEKMETAAVFIENYVTLEAEEGEEADLPLYFSETISDGMRVKQLEFVISGGNAVYFGSEISLAELFEAVGMDEAETYSFIASDGFETQVPAAAIEFGKIYADPEEGFMRAGFDGYDFGDIKGGGKVKHLVSIKAQGGTNEASQAGDTVGKTLLQCTTGDKTVDISEADFLALPQIEKELTRTNSKGETTTGVYRGVHWSELAKFVGTDASVPVLMKASDGFESVVAPDILNDADSLFALYENGEHIKSDGDGRVWFCASENFTANNWVKYIVKIVVE